MTIDNGKLNREAIKMAENNAVLRYRLYTLTPALKLLLDQCVHIEAQLIIEDSPSLNMFKKLRHEIIDLLKIQKQEDAE